MMTTPLDFIRTDPKRANLLPKVAKEYLRQRLEVGAVSGEQVIEKALEGLAGNPDTFVSSKRAGAPVGPATYDRPNQFVSQPRENGSVRVFLGRDYFKEVRVVLDRTLSNPDSPRSSAGVTSGDGGFAPNRLIGITAIGAFHDLFSDGQ